MDILEKEQVRKYFGRGISGTAGDNASVALDILRSMQEPVRKGDKVLTMMKDGTPELTTVDSDGAVAIIGDAFHPHYLRLPDKFQTAGKNPRHFEATCPSCNELLRHDCWSPEKCPTGCGKECPCCKPAGPEKATEERTTGAKNRCRCVGGCCC